MSRRQVDKIPAAVLRLSLLAAVSLTACGGNPGTTAATTDTSSGVSVAASFPTGLSVGVPTDLSATTASTSSAGGSQASGWRYTRDFGRALWTAASEGDARTLSQLATVLMPGGPAHAATTVEPDVKADAAVIDRLASGGAGLSLASVLDLNKLFGGNVTNAACYGPNMLYNQHDDGPDAAPAQLPGGDLGLWLATEGATSQPCIAAQLNARVSGIKGRVKQGLRLMALMRKTATTLPAAGSSVDVRESLQALLSAVPAFDGITIDAATLALDSGGTVYTYRLVVSMGTGFNAATGEVLMRHTPGSSGTAYSGVMQVAGFQLGNDGAFGCSDEIDSTTGRYKVARVSTIKYSRDGNDIQFGSREGRYCGHASASDATSPQNYGAQVAALTVDGQLDPTVKVTGMPAVRGSTKGWRGDFTRFAGDYDRSTLAGDFLLAWQAGPNDGNARALAAHADFNTTTETRMLDGYFAFTADVASTNGTLLGMICNWAGPGNNHTPLSRFQFQRATLASSATEYSLSSSLITYAPTQSCSASATMSFDANADGTLAAGEGASTASALDVPSGSNTVQQEVEARGFAKPGLF